MIILEILYVYFICFITSMSLHLLFDTDFLCEDSVKEFMLKLLRDGTIIFIVFMIFFVKHEVLWQEIKMLF